VTQTEFIAFLKRHKHLHFVASSERGDVFVENEDLPRVGAILFSANTIEHMMAADLERLPVLQSRRKRDRARKNCD